MSGFNYEQPQVNKGVGLGAEQFAQAAGDKTKDGSGTLKECLRN